MTARLLYSATASLDGYIAGPGGDMSWLAAHVGAPNPTAERLLSQVRCLLIGKRTFTGDDPNAGTEAEGAFGGQYDGPCVVLTHHPPAEAVPGVTFCTDLSDAVDAARAAAGDGIVNILGADVARQCLTAGLLDEVLLFFAPVLLGDGTRVLDLPGGTSARLEPVSGDGTHWYRVR